MADKKHKKDKGTSLAKGPVALLGLASLAWGILHFILGGDRARAFEGTNPVDGMVNGGSFLGFEGNGWTNLLWVAAGLLLLFGSPMHWGAKTMSIIVGLALGAASVISMIDGSDVFGIFATNGPTQLLLGLAASVLLITALLPRVGKKKHHDRDHDVDMHRPVRTERPVERERVIEREPRIERERTMTDARPANVVDRQVVGHDDRDSINEPRYATEDERGGRFVREERITERTTGGTTRRDERL